jgi:hypothetical protein
MNATEEHAQGLPRKEYRHMERPRVDQIMQVGLGFWASKTLLSAVEMELFTELAKHPEDLESLQARLRLHPRSARDFLFRDTVC